jgi:23S rRNA (guanosine2251-2'-O)-methyltransferase
MIRIVVIAHNLRSAHNVGSLLRTAEGLGVRKVYLTGYTPYPLAAGDKRLPHIAQRADKQIAKTALGAENTAAWKHAEDISLLIAQLKRENFSVTALEQAEGSQPLPAFKPPQRVALVVGREVEGIEPDVLHLCDNIVEIPMRGKKESFNVTQAAAMALYALSFY